MKLFDNKKIILIIVASIIGLALTAFLIYEQTGSFGKVEIISITLTALILAVIVYFVFRTGNK